jgi:hypothetical protein
MGACDFYCEEIGADAKEAFEKAVKSAQHWNGHGGYTGTIAEKECSGFRMVEMSDLPEGRDIEDRAMLYMKNEYDNREKDRDLYDETSIDSKWGPAGCVDMGNNKYFFFGNASC